MSGLRLGVSADILPYSTQEVLDADFRLNKFLLGTVSYASQGLALGIIGSLFFLKKQRIVFYGAGFGGGLALFQ